MRSGSVGTANAYQKVGDVFRSHVVVVQYITVIHNRCDGDITVILNFISKGFGFFLLTIISKRGGFLCAKKFTMEAKVGIWEFSQGSVCVG